MAKHVFKPSRLIAVYIDHENPKNPFITAEDVSYSGPLISVNIPKNFRHDGASVPRILWWLLPRVGRWSRAALVHDYLYREKPQGVSKRISDAVFYSIMENDKVNVLTRFIMFKSVVFFGGKSWKENK